MKTKTKKKSRKIVRTVPLAEAIRQVLQESEKGLTLSEVVAFCQTITEKVTLSGVSATLSTLKKRNVVTNPGGKWMLMASVGTQAAPKHSSDKPNKTVELLELLVHINDDHLNSYNLAEVIDDIFSAIELAGGRDELMGIISILDNLP